MDAITIIAQAAGGPLGDMGSLVMFAGIGLLFYFLILRPQSKARKEHAAFVKGLSVGDEVVTQSGILGKISGVEEHVVALEVGKGFKIRVLRSQISGAQSDALARAEKGEPPVGGASA